MVVDPVPTHCARPPTLGALAIVATEADEELQWLFSVMSCVVASLNVPVAVNCCVPPTVAVGEAGVIKSDTRVPVPIVRVVVPVTPDEDAEMVTEPPFFPCAIPELRMEARFGFEDFHMIPVRFVPVLPSLKVPVAVSLIDVPFAILGFDGVMLMETSCTVETVKPVEPLIVPKAALIVVLPLATLDARPVALIVAAAGFEEVQTTDAVMSCVLLSLKVPVAVNCLVVLVGIVEFAGVTAMETKVAAVSVRDAVPLTDPDVAVIVVVPVPTLVASPVGSMVATDVEDEDQASEVSSWVLPSSKLPTAVNC